eukprot:9489240-Pyramimonas_sp.AAC.2
MVLNGTEMWAEEGARHPNLLFLRWSPVGTLRRLTIIVSRTGILMVERHAKLLTPQVEVDLPLATLLHVRS